MNDKKEHKLIGAIVIDVDYYENKQDIVHSITFKKCSKKLVLKIEGFECETYIEG